MEFLDVFITVIIVVIVLAGNILKLKKKYPPSPKDSVTDQVDEDDEELSFESVDFANYWSSQNEKKETNSSKEEQYFTYETDSGQDVAKANPKPDSSRKTDEIHLQEVENEIETNNLDLHDSDELKKAIIYGEILKNPYN